MSWQQNDIYNEAKREAEQERRIAWRDWLEMLAFYAMVASIVAMWLVFMGLMFRIIIN